jgi:nucleoside-diphosphate-sugar epimerase
VPRIVYVSTMGVFGSTGGRTVEPELPETGSWLSEYHRTKYLAHNVAGEFVERGAPVVICCPGLVYGPDDPKMVGQLLRRLLRRQLPMLPGGKESGGAWVHVEDVADGLIAAAEKGQPGAVYPLGRDRITHEEAVRFIGEVSGVRMPPVMGTGPLPLMIALMSVVAALFPVPEHYHPETLAQLNGVTWWVSDERTRQDLGFNPRPYREGLRETILYEMDKLGLR